jgi:hypothetical protein
LSDLGSIAAGREQFPLKEVDHGHSLPKNLVGVEFTGGVVWVSEYDLESDLGPRTDDPVPPFADLEPERVGLVREERQAKDVFVFGESQ